MAPFRIVLLAVAVGNTAALITTPRPSAARVTRRFVAPPLAATAPPPAADPFAHARRDQAAPERFGAPFVAPAARDHAALGKVIARVDAVLLATEDPAAIGEKNGASRARDAAPCG